MFRRRDPAAPTASAEPQGQPSATNARVEMPRRIVDVPGGPSTVGATASATRSFVGAEAPGAVADAGAATVPDPRDGRQLTVGEGIRLKGEISACDRLIVLGHVDATLEQSEVLDIGKGGCFEGKTEVAAAEIAGRFRGDLVVRGRLLVRSTGVVEGTIRFGELEIERGGQLKGDVGVHEEPAPKLTAMPPAAAAQGD